MSQPLSPQRVKTKRRGDSRLGVLRKPDCRPFPQAVEQLPVPDTPRTFIARDSARLFSEAIGPQEVAARNGARGDYLSFQVRAPKGTPEFSANYLSLC